ncbi:DUF6265 family protein [Sinomicrobium weinanense]|uniref:DUF6265 domain-containing protein n=1 Tax=Sinomicrobium weinanense TaxID=2842200 RepID=A0A926Q5B2_9FLAO|nr:DUF6265 family protein [Sinomicrobium weinanense]MBC9797966.1 hypothetical protein [Sinomicrobium weinanense]MBU3123098.1 hypothetical protein [Sinomicrobium weinanense]
MKTLLLLLFVPITFLHAQQTLKWQENTIPSKAALADVSWISGHWKGEALGGIAEEIWSSPLGDSMMGSFKLVADNKVKFYELCTINQTGPTLLLRIKHFDNDMKGWEEKDQSEDFRLIKIEKNKAFFDGITFEKVSDNELSIHVLFQESGEEATFNYKRVK